jgi:hypothetical protein
MKQSDHDWSGGQSEPLHYITSSAGFRRGVAGLFLLLLGASPGQSRLRLLQWRGEGRGERGRRGGGGGGGGGGPS